MAFLILGVIYANMNSLNSSFPETPYLSGQNAKNIGEFVDANVEDNEEIETKIYENIREIIKKCFKQFSKCKAIDYLKHLMKMLKNLEPLQLKFLNSEDYKIIKKVYRKCFRLLKKGMKKC